MAHPLNRMTIRPKSRHDRRSKPGQVRLLKSIGVTLNVSPFVAKTGQMTGTKNGKTWEALEVKWHSNSGRSDRQKKIQVSRSTRTNSGAQKKPFNRLILVHREPCKL
jgi:hypothetical protein